MSWDRGALQVKMLKGPFMSFYPSKLNLYQFYPDIFRYLISEQNLSSEQDEKNFWILNITNTKVYIL